MHMTVKWSPTWWLFSALNFCLHDTELFMQWCYHDCSMKLTVSSTPFSVSYFLAADESYSSESVIILCASIIPNPCVRLQTCTLICMRLQTCASIRMHVWLVPDYLFICLFGLSPPSFVWLHWFRWSCIIWLTSQNPNVACWSNQPATTWFLVSISISSSDLWLPPSSRALLSKGEIIVMNRPRVAPWPILDPGSGSYLAPPICGHPYLASRTDPLSLVMMGICPL